MMDQKAGISANDLCEMEKLLIELYQRMEITLKSIRPRLALPPEDLTSAINVVRVTFVGLRERIRLCATQEKLEMGGPAPDAETLQELRDAVRRIEESCEASSRVADIAAHLLGKVQELTGDEKILGAVRVMAADLLEDIKKGIADLKELKTVAGGDHPLAALHTLAFDQGELSTEQGARLYAIVCEAFGDALPFAAITGKLRSSPSSEQDPGETEQSEEVGDKSQQRIAGEHVALEEEPTVDAPLIVGERGETRSPDISLELAEERQPTDPATRDSRQARRADKSASTVARAKSSKKRAKTKRTSVDVRSAGISEGGSSRTSNQFTAEATVQDIARRALLASGKELNGLLIALVWALVRDDRLSLAHQIAKLTEGDKEIVSFDWPLQHVMKALALHSWVRGEQGEIEEELGGCLRELVHAFSLPKDSRGGCPGCDERLLFAIALRPALIAPNTTGAPELLDLLDLQDFPHFHQLQAAIRQLRTLGLDLTADILKGVREKVKWEADLERLKSECDEWLVRNRQAQIIYSATTRVWQEWLRDDGMIGKTIRAAIEDRREQAAQVRETLKKLSNKADLAEELRKTDARIRGSTAKKKPIDGKAVQAIIKHTGYAAALPQRWLNLLATEPAARSDYQLRQASECRDKTLGCLQKAREQLLRIEEEPGQQLEDVASLRAVLKVLEGVLALFDPAATDKPVPPMRSILCEDLVRVQGLSLDQNWEPVIKEGSQLREGLLGQALQSEEDWTSALKMQIEADNFQSGAWILEKLRDLPVEQEDLEQLQAGWDEALATARMRAGSKKAEVEVLKNRALLEGVFPESELKELEQKLDDIDPDELVDFGAAIQTLQDVESTIVAARNDRISVVREELAGLNLGKQFPEDRARVEAALDRGDLPIAYDYMERLQKREALPAEVESEHFISAFFPNFAEEFVQHLDEIKKSGRNRTASRLIETMKEGGRIGPLDMSRVPDAQAQSAAQMLAAWLTLKRKKQPIETYAHQVLEGLGFAVRNLSLTGDAPTSRKAWLKLRTDVIRDRQVCIVPRLGSQAAGYYNLLCVWDSPSEDEVILETKASGGDAPVIVFYLGRLTTTRRLGFAELCRRHQRTVLLIDETLLCFLCGARGSRLALAFRCCLPFTVAEPYTTTASLVPPEMFFGRRRERESVISSVGSNLVYGGRQLGKTALLRDVERAYNNPEDGLYVKWIDLKMEGIGENRSVADIWAVISDALFSMKILKKANVRRHDTVLRQVMEWLEEQENRRIVFLMDEADAFLRQDADDGFVQMGHLKGLMDQTNRRFKAVFAGLHNVQRTSRNPNTPLAHLGSPICIGPLLEGGEWREAMAMVREPLETLGFRFDSTDVVLKILAYTNYYPSLIQLFGKHLLENLNERPRMVFGAKGHPPHLITMKHVDDVYQNDEHLRKAIVDRFKWTLDLDPRYRVIALVIALETLDRRSARQPASGLSVEWIRGDALEWWPDGFEDSGSLEDVRTILEEMLGLGVLRKTDGDHYALRNPNLLRLLGSYEEMERDLSDASDREPPPRYDPADFRRPDPDNLLLRSPLTAAQESEILEPSNGVLVAFGSNMSGRSELTKFLKLTIASHPSAELLWLNDMSERRPFRDRLDEAYEKRATNVTIVGVAPSCSWSVTWVADALEMLNRKATRKNFLRVLFVGDPDLAWSWARLDNEIRKNLIDKGLRLLCLKPWTDSGLRRWLSDNHFGPADNSNERERFAKVTGRWPTLLLELGTRCKKDSFSRWSDHLTEIGQEVESTDRWDTTFELPGEVHPMLQAVAKWGGTDTVEDIAMYLVEENAGPKEFASQLIDWGETLAFFTMAPERKWRIDRVLKMMLDRGTK